MDANYVVPPEPTYLKFWLCVQRLPWSSQLPYYFDRRFHKRLPEKCYLEDEAGTRFLVILKRRSMVLEFDLYLENLLSHYQQPWGAWVQCEFIDAINFDTFKIKVFNLDLLPIVPPERKLYDTPAKAKAKRAQKYLHWFDFEGCSDAAGGVGNGSSKFSTSSSPSSDDALPKTSDEDYFPEIVVNNNKATSGQRGRKKRRHDRK